MVPLQPLDRSARVYVAGHRGMVGSAVWRCLAAQGFTDLVGATSAELDLREAGAVQSFFEATKPEVVVLAAARVGGILANVSAPADFLADNLRIQVNVMQAAQRVGVDRLLFLGSSCIYPRLAPQPISESALLTGALEQTNDGYAIAKIAGHRAGAGPAPPVRRPLHLGDADQPVRAGRQLRPARLTRAAGDDPPLPRGPAGRRARP